MILLFFLNFILRVMTIETNELQNERKHDASKHDSKILMTNQKITH